MSLYKDASLVMIPSAYKDGKLYSIRPTDGSGDFTFSRGSNLAATRVDVNGLIEKGRENLLLQSNQFDTTWQLTTNTTITGGQSGYDGSNNAWLLTKDDNQYRAVYQDVSVTGVWTLSVYAKSNTLDIITLRDSDSQGRVEFDLSDGSVNNVRTENIIAYDISSVGNDWYRCQVSFSGTTSRIQFYADFNDPTEAGSIYIQDAQLEQGLVATDYIETGASTAQAGILEDMPRLDYSGSCPALLLEPQRTNLLGQSEYFGASYWQKIRTTILDNEAISPVGNLDASKLVEDNSLDTHLMWSQNISISVGDVITWSVFAKKAERNWIYLRDTNAGNFTSWFDLENGVVGTKSGTLDANIEDVGNGWYRCSISYTSTSTTAKGRIYTALDNNIEPYQGDGTSGVYIYGAQLEQGSYPTSYIPTYGTSQTRSNDLCTATSVSDLIDSTQGTMFLDFKALANVLPSEYSYFSMNDGTYNNRISILQSVNSTNQVRVFAFVGGTKVFDMNDSVTDITTQTKVALRYAENAFDVFINGVKTSTDTSGSIFPANTLDRISFSEIGTTSSAFKGKVNQALVFPTALTDSECIALTTL